MARPTLTHQALGTLQNASRATTAQQMSGSVFAELLAILTLKDRLSAHRWGTQTHGPHYRS